MLSRHSQISNITKLSTRRLAARVIMTVAQQLASRFQSAGPEFVFRGEALARA